MNPKGQGRQSHKINKLPFLDMSEITAKALEKAEKRRGVYTPAMFYKSYRVASKIFPSLWMMKVVKNFIKGSDDFRFAKIMLKKKHQTRIMAYGIG